jgi:hypothetical protein
MGLLLVRDSDVKVTVTGFAVSNNTPESVKFGLTVSNGKGTFTWDKTGGILLERWCNGLSKSIDLKRGGKFCSVSGGSVYLDNTIGLQKFLSGNSIDVSGSRIDIYFAGRRLAVGVVTGFEYGINEFTLNYDEPTKYRNAIISKLMDDGETYYPAVLGKPGMVKLTSAFSEPEVITAYGHLEDDWADIERDILFELYSSGTARDMVDQSRTMAERGLYLTTMARVIRFDNRDFFGNPLGSIFENFNNALNAVKQDTDPGNRYYLECIDGAGLGAYAEILPQTMDITTTPEAAVDPYYTITFQLKKSLPVGINGEMPFVAVEDVYKKVQGGYNAYVGVKPLDAGKISVFRLCKVKSAYISDTLPLNVSDGETPSLYRYKNNEYIQVDQSLSPSWNADKNRIIPMGGSITESGIRGFNTLRGTDFFSGFRGVRDTPFNRNFDKTLFKKLVDEAATTLPGSSDIISVLSSADDSSNMSVSLLTDYDINKLFDGNMGTGIEFYITCQPNIVFNFPFKVTFEKPPLGVDITLTFGIDISFMDGNVTGSVGFGGAADVAEAYIMAALQTNKHAYAGLKTNHGVTRGGSNPRCIPIIDVEMKPLPQTVNGQPVYNQILSGNIILNTCVNLKDYRGWNAQDYPWMSRDATHLNNYISADNTTRNIIGAAYNFLIGHDYTSNTSDAPGKININNDFFANNDSNEIRVVGTLRMKPKRVSGSGAFDIVIRLHNFQAVYQTEIGLDEPLYAKMQGRSDVALIDPEHPLTAYAMYNYILRLQNYEQAYGTPASRPPDGWGTGMAWEPSNINDAIFMATEKINAFSRYPSVQYEVGRQLFDAGELGTQNIKDELLKTLWAGGLLTYDGRESIFSMLEEPETYTVIAYTDIVPNSIGKLQSPRKEDIFCEPFIRYNWDIGGEKFADEIRVLQSDAEVYQEGYVIGGNINTSERRLLWDRCHRLYRRARIVNDAPNTLTENNWLYRSEDAYQYLLNWLEWMGEGETSFAREEITFTLSVRTAINKEIDVGSHITIELPYLQQDPLVGIITSVSWQLEKGREEVRCKAFIKMPISDNGERRNIVELGNASIDIVESGERELNIIETGSN